MSKSRYITGLRAVEQVLATDASEVRRIFAEYQTANPRVEAIIKSAQLAGIEIQAANRARLAQMSGEERHQGVIAEVQRSTVLDEAGLRTMVEKHLAAANGKPLLLLVLDGVQDPHNLGACMRTADAAGVDAIIVPRHAAAGLSPTVSKVAAGAAAGYGARAHRSQPEYSEPLRHPGEPADGRCRVQPQRLSRHGRLPL